MRHEAVGIPTRTLLLQAWGAIRAGRTRRCGVLYARWLLVRLGGGSRCRRACPGRPLSRSRLAGRDRASAHVITC
eukprot:3349890-Prymnesium_polylepis.1